MKTFENLKHKIMQHKKEKCIDKLYIETQLAKKDEDLNKLFRSLQKGILDYIEVNNKFKGTTVESDAKNLENYRTKLHDTIRASIRQYPEILYLKSATTFSEPLGLQVCRLGFEDLALEILETNKLTAFQQNPAGENMAMIALGNGMPKVALKFFDYPESLDHICRHNHNIPNEYVIDNFNHSFYTGKDDNIAFTAIKAKSSKSANWSDEQKSDYDNVILKCLENKDVRTYTSSNHHGIGILMMQFQEHFDDEILFSAISHDDVCTQVNLYDGKNMGMYCAQAKKEKLVLKALDNHIASTHQNHNGENIGMIATYHGLEEATLKALENEEASVQQNSNGQNIGMIAAFRQMEKATLKALDNKEASIQQDKFGENIGSHALKNNLFSCVYKALENETAAAQYNYTHRTIAHKAIDKYKYSLSGPNEKSELLNIVSISLENPEARKVQSENGNTIGMYLALNLFPNEETNELVQKAASYTDSCYIRNKDKKDIFTIAKERNFDLGEASLLDIQKDELDEIIIKYGLDLNDSNESEM